MNGNHSTNTWWVHNYFYAHRHACTHASQDLQTLSWAQSLYMNMITKGIQLLPLTMQVCCLPCCTPCSPPLWFHETAGTSWLEIGAVHPHLLNTRGESPPPAGTTMGVDNFLVIWLASWNEFSHGALCYMEPVFLEQSTTESCMSQEGSQCQSQIG